MTDGPCPTNFIRARQTLFALVSGEEVFGWRATDDLLQDLSSGVAPRPMMLLTLWLSGRAVVLQMPKSAGHP